MTQVAAEALKGCRVALVLAGGNALGAYQAGVYQALQAHGIEPEWVVGTSIGAINGAVIAGNAPDRRMARLHELWRPSGDAPRWPDWWDVVPDSWRRTGEVLGTLLAGRSGMFGPIGTSLSMGLGVADDGTPALYDTHPLSGSLAALVDLDQLNRCDPRFAALAVDLDSGEDAVFDSRDGTVTIDHIRASASLPPAYPAVPIDGRMFVDGGLSANLPLDPVLSDPGEDPLLCIAVDLLPIVAPRPRTLGEMVGRTQDLLFGCQARRGIERWQDRYRYDADLARRSVTLVRLAYADQAREVAGKAMDFSPESARLRWAAGERDGLALVQRLADGPLRTGRPGLTVDA